MKAAPRDRAEVAVVARNAHANGTSMAEAVAAHFDITLRAAYKLVDRARHSGHHIPPARLGPNADKYAAKLQRCADVALAAIEAGQPIGQAVGADDENGENADQQQFFEGEPEHTSRILARPVRHCP
jgi:hypothetical protein